MTRSGLGLHTGSAGAQPLHIGLTNKHIFTFLVLRPEAAPILQRLAAARKARNNRRAMRRARGDADVSDDEGDENELGGLVVAAPATSGIVTSSGNAAGSGMVCATRGYLGMLSRGLTSFWNGILVVPRWLSSLTPQQQEELLKTITAFCELMATIAKLFPEPKNDNEGEFQEEVVEVEELDDFGFVVKKKRVVRKRKVEKAATKKPKPEIERQLEAKKSETSNRDVKKDTSAEDLERYWLDL